MLKCKGKGIETCFESPVKRSWTIAEARLERSDGSSLHPLDFVLLFTSFELKLQGNDKLVVVSKLPQLAPCFPSLRYGKLRTWLVKVSSELGLLQHPVLVVPSANYTRKSSNLCKHSFPTFKACFPLVNFGHELSNFDASIKFSSSKLRYQWCYASIHPWYARFPTSSPCFLYLCLLNAFL